MCSAFIDCSSLESLDLSGIDTRNVENMSYLFEDCKNLKSINYGKFNTAKVNDMENMFKGCEAFTGITFPSGFTTENATNMAGMFSYCKGLTAIDANKKLRVEKGAFKKLHKKASIKVKGVKGKAKKKLLKAIKN